MGGIRYQEQVFDEAVAGILSSLMMFASLSLLIPAAFEVASSESISGAHDNVLVLSRGTAVILLVLYVLCLVFRFRTHPALFKYRLQHLDGEEQPEGDSEINEEANNPSPVAAGLVFSVTTVFIVICTIYLVNSIGGFTQAWRISKTSVGLFLLPTIRLPNLIDCCVLAWEDDLNLAFLYSIRSSTQAALFVMPLMVLLGWAIGQSMTLRFQSFESVVFFLSVLVVNRLNRNGRGNYLKGALCLGM